MDPGMGVAGLGCIVARTEDHMTVAYSSIRGLFLVYLSVFIFSHTSLSVISGEERPRWMAGKRKEREREKEAGHGGGSPLYLFFSSPTAFISLSPLSV